MTDSDWIASYAACVHDIVHRHGGRYLTRSGNIEVLEGPSSGADLIALIAFPSQASAEAFMADPAYAPFAAARRKGSESRLCLVDATDLAGEIAYLPKG